MVIIYSERTGRIRRRIFEGDQVQSDEQLLAIHGPEAGEEYHVGANVTQEQLSAITGLVPINDRYALVDAAGDVTGAIPADHVIDSLPGLTLVAHATAEIGWRQMLDASFQRSLKRINADITRQNNQLNGPLLASRYSLNPNHIRGKTAAQVEAARRAEVATAQALLVTLSAERTARLAPR